jgi:hypothetical protein
MAIGQPGLPGKFLWMGNTLKIDAVLRTRREIGKCRHGSPELFVRNHWYEVAVTGNITMKIYFDRHPRGEANSNGW